MDFKKMTTRAVFGAIVRQVAFWFFSAAFIWWGWNIFAQHFSLPQFKYMEVFAMRMALTYIMAILWQKPNNK